MKKIVVVLLAVLMLTGLAFADQNLTTSQPQPTIDRFKIDVFKIDATGLVEVVATYGYDDAGTFVAVRNEQIAITNDAVYVNRRPAVQKSDGADPNIFDDFPAAYQSNPATAVIGEVNGGTFGGQANLKAYLEVIIKTILGL